MDFTFFQWLFGFDIAIYIPIFAASRLILSIQHQSNKTKFIESIVEYTPNNENSKKIIEEEIEKYKIVFPSFLSILQYWCEILFCMVIFYGITCIIFRALNPNIHTNFFFLCGSICIVIHFILWFICLFANGNIQNIIKQVSLNDNDM